MMKQGSAKTNKEEKKKLKNERINKIEYGNFMSLVIPANDGIGIKRQTIFIQNCERKFSKNVVNCNQ